MLNYNTVRLLLLQKQRRLQRHQKIAAGPSEIPPTSVVQETSNKANAIAASPLQEKPPGSSADYQNTAKTTLKPFAPSTSSTIQQLQNQASASLAPFEIATGSQWPSSVKLFPATPKFGTSELQGPTGLALSPVAQTGALQDYPRRGVSAAASKVRLSCKVSGDVSGVFASTCCKTFASSGWPQDVSGGARDDAATESIAAREAASCASSALALGHPVVSDSGMKSFCSYNSMQNSS